MHSLIRSTLLVTLVVLPGSLLVIDEVAAQSTSTLGRVGNEALRQGDYDAAIEQYELALQATKADPRIQYNKAIAHYRKGEIDAARGLFGKVVGSADPALAARARYNMGNVDYSLATQVASQDAGAATNLLRSAISHYRGSLAADPDDPDARANIELAARFMRQLKRQQDQQQSDQQNQQQGDPQNQQQGDQQNQQQSDQSSDDSQGDDSQDDSQPDQSQSGDGNQDQQNQDQDQDQQDQDEDQDQQPQDQPEQDQQSGDDSEQQQDSESQSSDGPGDSEQESGDEDSSQQDSEESESGEQSEQDSSNGQQQPPSEEPEEQQSQNGNQQQDAAQSDEQPSDPQQANQDNADDASQQPPDGELKALNEEGEGDEVPGYRPQQIQQSQKMTMQEARKMLQAVRDRDLRRRLQKLQQMRARRIPVEKDW